MLDLSFNIYSDPSNFSISAHREAAENQYLAVHDSLQVQTLIQLELYLPVTFCHGYFFGIVCDLLMVEWSK